MKKLVLLAFGLLTFTTASAQPYDIQTQSIGSTNLPSNAVRVPFLEASITAREDIAIKSITVKQTGLSDNEDISGVRAYLGYRRSLLGSVDNDGNARLRFLRPVIIKAGSTQTITITANLDSRGGRSIGFSLQDIELTDVTSYATSSSRSIRNYRGSSRRTNYRSFTRNGQTHSASSRNRFSDRSVSQTSSYQVPSLNFTILGNNDVKLDWGVNRLGRFRVQNKSRQAATLEQVTLKNLGTADIEEALSNVSLSDQFNNRVASAVASDRKSITFQFDQNYKLGGGDTQIFSIWGDITGGRRGETLQFTLDESDDLVSTVNSFSSGTNTRSLGRSSTTSTFRSGGNVSLSRSIRNTALWNQNYNPGSRDVVFVSQNIRHKAPIFIETVRAFVAAGSFASDKNGNGQNSELEDYEDTFTELKLYIDGKLADRDPEFTMVNGTNLIEFEANQEIYTTTQIMVTGRIGSGAQNGDRLRLTIDPLRSFPDYELLR